MKMNTINVTGTLTSLGVTGIGRSNPDMLALINPLGTWYSHNPMIPTETAAHGYPFSPRVRGPE